MPARELSRRDFNRVQCTGALRGFSTALQSLYGVFITLYHQIRGQQNLAILLFNQDTRTESQPTAMNALLVNGYKNNPGA
jgi:hypothetical protein